MVTCKFRIINVSILLLIGASLPGRLPLHHEFTIPLVDQVNQWVTYGSRVIPHPPDETLTTWWIGINDTGDSNRNTTVRVLEPVFEKKKVMHGP